MSICVDEYPVKEYPYRAEYKHHLITPWWTNFVNSFPMKVFRTHDSMISAFNEKLAQDDAVLLDGSLVTLYFKDEEARMMFILKWS